MLDPGAVGPDDLERVAKEAEQAMRRLADLQGQLDAVRGIGTAAGGQIVVGADSSGRIDSIELNPRVMRMPSQDLADELLRAVNAAQDDCLRQTRDLVAQTGVDTSVDEAAFEAMERRLTDAHAAFMRTMEGH
ncbi:DNA-binding protein YbaB [Nonomuraea polychroma]|uniref:DNA-binding protein YbaB n=1 Tax=Nonomuraea polychroma TaxID=46176 RepID=A0A438ME52_9ACTN|nr:DNA-binding protein YbaB [Nonomuraea polychroma]